MNKNKTNTNINMYIKFRTEIEEMYAPYVLNQCDVIEIFNEKNKKIGILCVDDKYIDGLYILPEYRNKGYATKAVMDYIKKYGTPEDLTILNTNTPALNFWTSIFDLTPIENNGIDTYYCINGLKNKNESLTCQI